MFRIKSQHNQADNMQYTIASLLSVNNISSKIQIANEPILPTAALQELEIDVQKCSPEALQELAYVLTQVLNYPSAVQSDTHSRANRLGLTDLIEDNTVHPQPQAQNQEKQQHDVQHCKDCGLIVQKETIPFCSSFKQFPKVGIGIYLLFQCFKNVGILIILLGSIFSVYALYVNITQPSEILSFQNLPTKLSYGPVITNLLSNTSLQSSLVIQGWLVFIVIVVWVFILMYMNVQDVKIQQMIDIKTITASDFTVMIENMPFKMSKQELQIEFDEYYKRLLEGNYLQPDSSQDSTKAKPKSFKIKKVCKGVPFYLLQDEKAAKRLQEIQETALQLRQKFADWVSEVQKDCKFTTTSKEERSAEYEKYLQLKKQREQIQSSKYSAYESKGSSVGAEETVFFVTFEKSQSANIICQLNPQSISQKFRQLLGCCSTVFYFKLFSQQYSDFNIKLSRAPQPEDVSWENIGMKFDSITKRKFLTFFVTLLLLGVSFGAVYGLTLLQLNETNPVLIYGTSVIITVVNQIIATAIYNLTIYQRNMTKTSRQISLAIKTILAQLVNSILIPVIVDVYYLQNIYYSGGLVADVYYIAVINAVLPPALQLINSSYLISRILAWYKKRANPRLMLEQQQLNQYNELPQYELGYAYIYYLDCFYFTCFYVTMHPFVVIPSLVGVFLMYWVQKHRLLQRSSRPIPSTSMLADAMWQLIFLGPFVLTIGHLTWYNLLTDSTLNFSYIYASQILSVVISVTFFVLPIDSMMHSMFASPDQELLDFDQCWGKLKSDYDRLNPATKEQGLGFFIKFIQSFKELKNSPQKSKKKQKQTNTSLQMLNFTQEELVQNDKKLSYVQEKETFKKLDSNTEKERNIFLELQEQQQNQRKVQNIFEKPQSKIKGKAIKNRKPLQRKGQFDTLGLILSGTKSTNHKTKPIPKIQTELQL